MTSSGDLQQIFEKYCTLLHRSVFNSSRKAEFFKPVMSVQQNCVLEHIYNPITAMQMRQCLPFSWTTLRGKHCWHPIVGWSKNPVSSQTEKLMAGTKFSDYLGLNHYEKAKKLKHFIHLRLTNRPQSFGS